MIEVINISKSFEDKEVLRNINIQFAKGKCNLIIGQSGSGKTVLMKTLVGLFKPDEGEIRYGGRIFNKMTIQEQIEDKLAEAILDGRVGEGDSITVSFSDGQIAIGQGLAQQPSLDNVP